MTQEPIRPRLEIPVPNHPPPYDHEETRQPQVGDDQEINDPHDEEKRVIIVDI